MPIVQRPDIQGLLRHGYPYFKDAAYCLFRIRDRIKFGDWLEELRNHWLDESHERKASVVKDGFGAAIAFTASGLRELGLGEALNTFPSEFQEGMALQHRSRLLGDVGDNCPSKWDWGAAVAKQNQKVAEQDKDKAKEQETTFATDEGLHGVVMVFAEKGKALGRVEILKGLNGCPEIVQVLPTELRVRRAKDLDSKALDREIKHDSDEDEVSTEPFGFADGISQPYVEGLMMKKPPQGVRAVKAGEFVLGYVNEAGYLPASPSVEEPGCLEGREDLSGRGDLGRNGTFLVMRQLAQNVDEFRKATHDNEELAARLVGRWKTGEPLVRYVEKPNPDPTGDELRLLGHKPLKRTLRELEAKNDFSYHREDRYGFRCPIGAHIRRANPRDALADGLGIDRETAQELVDQHRLLRRGRVYGPPEGEPGERGLIFICLNANIERQFEFVQSSWLLNPEFGGLQGEVDPILGPGGALTLQRPVLGQCVQGLKQFVTVKGGAYFFLPGLRAIEYLAAFARRPEKPTPPSPAPSAPLP